MVDFEGGKRGGFELENGVEDSLNPGSNSLQETTASGSNGTRVLAADANGVVVLPEGVSLDDITVVGRDLVINLADGSQIVIPDGAIIVPQLIIDGVAVPPLNLAALLNDAEINPEAEPTQVPSSGGNFAGDVGPIQDAFDLGDLLPYTDLARVVEEEEEVLPDIVNREPDVVIETPDNPVGVENAIATVAERGLPERGSEPEGTASETDAETTTGTIVFNAPDGLSAILINGVEISSVGQVFSSPFGDLTITSIDLANGEIGFSYTLADNLVGETVDGFFEATVIDRDGDTANASLSIIVEDDSPIAADDIGIVPAGSHDPITGNVLDNDEPGADDYSLDGAVSGFSNANGSAEPGETLQGEYGTLTLNADGSYTYTRDFNTPGGVSENFTYTIVDQDGSTDTAVLTINIEDAIDSIEAPSIGEGTVVEESGLPERGDPVEPEGTNETSDGETTSGTITFNSPDGVGSITIGGVELNLDNEAGNDADDQTVIDDETGTLVITSVTYHPVTGDGTITYEYTLADNTDGDQTVDGGNTTVPFEVVIVDLDDDVAEDTLVITIVDDNPDAIDDSASQDVENAPVTVDVFENDIEGADGVALETIQLVEGSLTGAGTLVNNGDGTFTYTPAPGEEGDENGEIFFDYIITDGDGDSDTATVTIELLPDSEPEISTEGENEVNEAGLPARDGEPEGSNEPSDSETTSGQIFIETGGDDIASLVINGEDVTNGGTVTTSKGVLTVTETDGEYSYSYTLTDNTLTDPDSDSFSLTVTDSDGDTASTSFTIDIIDDVPTARPDTDTVGEGQTTTGDVSINDTTGADDAVVTGVVAGSDTTNPVSGGVSIGVPGAFGTLTLNSDGTYEYVSDPDAVTAPGDVDVFVYTITDGDGDTSTTTLTINITDVTLDADDQTVVVNEAALDDTQDGSDLAAGNVTGSDPASTNETVTGQLDVTGAVSYTLDSFTGNNGEFQLNSDGSFTYTLTDPVLSPTGDNGTNTFNGVETVTYTATDANGNTVSGTITVNVIDDVPSVVVAFNESAPDAMLTQDAETEGDAFDTATADLSSLFSVTTEQYGADGAGSLVQTYDLGVVAQGADTGLTSDGAPIYIYELADGTIAGSTSDDVNLVDAGNTIFTLTVDEDTGVVTQTQFAEIDHPLPGDDAAPYDDQVITLGQGLVTLSTSVTITDADGDTDDSSDSADIGDLVAFADDGPTIGVTVTDGDQTLLNTQDAETRGTDFDVAQSGVNFSGAFSFVSPDFGADGAGSTEWNFSLDIVGTSGVLSNLSSDGDPVYLYKVGDIVIGSTQTPGGGDIDGTNIVFELSVDALSGVVTLEQYQEIDHPLPGDDSNYDAQELALATGLVNLVGEATITDGDGDSFSDTKTLDLGGNIVFDDDGPTAFDNSDTVGEGESTGGNVVTDVDVSGTDDSGADGYADDGAVVDADFVSGNQGITFTSKDVAPDGTVTIVTSAGTLTLAADGTYTFDSDANSINADAEIVFSYTIEDGDGDQATANLTIDITNVAGNVSASVIEVDEKGLADGSGELADPAPNTDQSEIDTGQISVINATGPFEYILTDLTAVFDDGGTADDTSDDTYTVDGTYGTIVLNASTGAYTYTLDEEFDHDPVQGTNKELAAEGFGFEVFDTNSNSIGTGTINVNITDDIPSIELDFSGNGGATLLTQDAETEGAAFDTATGQFAGAFAITSQVYGADGPGSVDTTYDLTLLAAAGTDTGLNSNGADIFIYELADGTIVGSTSNVAPASVDATVVFSLTVDTDTGAVTLTQYDEIDHPIVDDPSATEAPFEDQIATLADDLVGLTATADIEDFDGDTDSSSETLDLGGLVQFADDGPVVSTDDQFSEPQLEVDETDFATDDSGFFAGAFSTDFGADGDGGVVYTLATAGGASGLVDTLTDQPVTLSLNGSVVEGRNTDGYLVFTVSVDASTGEVTLSQLRAVVHADTNDDDDATGLTGSDLITLTATATDGDGDTDSETIDLTDNLSFRDDGPSVTPTGADLPTGLVTDDSDTPNDTAGPVDFSGLFNVEFGNDSFKDADNNDVEDADAVAYSLSITGGDGTASGLVDTLTGDAILLRMVGTDTIEGYLENSTTTVAFTITVDADNGGVSLEQDRAVQHDDPADPVESGASAAVMTGSLIKLTAEATDGDLDSDDATVDITAAFAFEDDGPTIDVTKGNDAGVILLTQDAETDGDPTDTDTATTSANFGGVFGLTSDGGADGAVTPVLSYALAVTNSTSELTSGGDAINLFLVGGVVVGSTAGDAGSITDGNKIFDISVSADGTVTLNQYQQIDHPIADDPTATEAPFEDQVIALADGKVSLTASSTITDGDGDQATDSETVDLGGNIRFADDGPSVSASNDDDDSVVAVTSDADITDFDALELSSLLSYDSEYGADGQGGADSVVYSLDIVGISGTDSGLTSGGNAVYLYKFGDDVIGSTQTPGGGDIDGTNIVFTLDLDTATGTVVVIQYMVLDHTDDGSPTDTQLVLGDNLINATISVTVIDADGDTATTTETADLGGNIAFNDDTPAARDADITLNVDEDELPGGITDGDGQNTTDSGSLAALFDTGNDLPGTFSFDLANFTDPNWTSGGDAIEWTTAFNGSVLIGYVGDPNTGRVIAVAIDNTETGDFSVQIFEQIDHLPNNPANDDVQTLTLDLSDIVKFTDFDGDEATVSAGSTVKVVVEDDIPTIDVTKGNDAGVILLTQDAETDGDPTDTDTATTSANFGGVFGLTSDGGADGAVTPVLSYALAVTNSTSELTSGGDAINLFLVGGVVVGSTAGDAGSITDGNKIFDISVSADGTVTLNQYQQIDHPIADDPTATEAPFEDQVIALADGKVSLTASSTITDGDGDQATDSETVDLGGNIRFADDGPVAIGGTSLSGVVDEDNVGGNEGGPDDIDGGVDTVTDTASGTAGNGETAANLFSAGADTPLTISFVDTATAVTYMESLNLSSGGLTLSYNIVSDGILALNANGPVFLMDLEENGDWLFTLYEQLDHPDDGNNDENEITIDFAPVIQATDADGDTAVATGELVVTVDDDTPVFGTNSATAPTLVTDDSDVELQNGIVSLDNDGNDFSTLFSPLYGADGPAASDAITYAFVLANGNVTDSGLDDSVTGDNILLRIVDNTVEGYLENDADERAFVLTLNDDGTIDQIQFRAIEHDNVNDPIETGNEAQAITSSAIKLTATITDGDGDSLTSDAVNIGASFTFEDDGPVVGTTQDLVVDEDGFPNANADSAPEQTDPLEIDSTESLTDAGVVTVQFRGDVPADTNASFAFVNPDALDGVLSSLGQPVDFELSSGDLVGTINGGATEVIRITLVGSGTVGTSGDVQYAYGVSLSQPLNHTFGDDSEAAVTLAGVQFEVTDSDGDSASGSFDVQIFDDVPSITASIDGISSVSQDETPSGVSGIAEIAIANIGNDPDVADDPGAPLGSDFTIAAARASLTISGAVGADESSIVTDFSISLASLPSFTATDGSPIVYSLELGGRALVARVDGGAFDGEAAFALTYDLSTGDFVFEQYLSLKHPDGTDPNDVLQLPLDDLTITLSVTDADGDTADVTVETNGVVINFLDDGPTLGDVTNGLDTVENTIGTYACVAQVDFDFGADGPDPSLSLILEPLTDIQGLRYVSNADGSLSAFSDNGTPGDTSDDVAFFNVTINPDDGCVDVELLSERPVNEVTTPLNFTEIAPGNYEFVTIEGATFDGGSYPPGATGPDEFIDDLSTINPSGNGFGINNNLVNPSEGFRFSFENATALDFVFNFQPNTAQVTITYEAVDENGVVFTGSILVVKAITGELSPVTIEGPNGEEFDQVTLFFDFPAGNNGGRVQDFGVTQTIEIFPDDQVLEFGLTVVDEDGDTVATSPTDPISITFEGEDPAPAMTSSGGTSSAMSFSTETNLLDDGTSGTGNGKGNGNGGSKDFFDGGTWGAGTFTVANDSLNDQLGMRSFSTSMTATAAFGAMMVNSAPTGSFIGTMSVSSSDAYTFAGMSSFEMLSMDSLGNFESVASMEWASNIETPISVNSNGKFGNHDAFTFDGMTDLADFGANGIEAGGFSEFLADSSAFDAAPAMMGMMDSSGSMMEALMALTLQAGGEAQLAEMAGLDTGAHVPELAAIMDDIMAEHAIDGLLDQIAGPANEIVGMDGEIGYLGNDALAAMIDTGAFAFDGNAMADMTEEAAALATMSA